MDTNQLARRAEQALSGLPASGPDQLLALLAEDVSWLVDWKGDGVFEHSDLFGRTRHAGRDGVRAFFERLARHRTARTVDLTRTLVGDGEVTVLGHVLWSCDGNGTTAGTDFSLRLVLHDGEVAQGRFLTLPGGHIETFVPDHRTSEDFDSARVERLVRDFQKLYFDAYVLGKTWSETYWMGTPVFKCPLDMWIYQEMIVELRPDVIVETGTCAGGSALFLAQMCDLAGKGRVVTVDIQPYKDSWPEHDRITYLLGSSTSEEILAQVRAQIPAGATVLVVLDSDHRCDHVLREMQLYSDLVTPGSYLVVEDSNLNGHPTKPSYGPGPMEAIDAFLREDSRFRVDREREKFLVTWNPRGYLLKVRA